MRFLKGKIGLQVQCRYRGWHAVTECTGLQLCCAELYWAVLEYTGLYWVVLDCSELYGAVRSYTGTYWAPLGCTGLYWAVMNFTVLYCDVLLTHG